MNVDVDSVDTNIVIFKLAAGHGAPEFAARLKERGVLISAFSADAIRLVTHLDVSRDDCIEAAEALTDEIEATAVGIS